MMRAALPIVSAFVLLSASSALAHAQRPVGEYEVVSRYQTSGVSLQMTADEEEGGDILFGVGRMWPMGPRGAWVPGVEVAAGVTSGRDVLARILAGPRASFTAAFPNQYVSLGRKTRGEPYLSAAGGVYAMADFRGDGTVWGGAPFVAAGAGFRMLNDPWDVRLTLVEVMVEQRFGIDDGGAEIHLRFTSAVPRAASSGDGRGPVAAPPPPPPPSPDTRR